MLYLVRHGQTDWNREKRFQSTTDVPLNDTGRAQAQAIRVELLRRGVRFEKAYTSPLGRALESTRLIMEGGDLSDDSIEIELAPELLELSFGEWEGRLESELAESYGERFAAWRASHYTQSPPGGEDLTDGAFRLRDFIGRILEDAVNGDVLVVAHQAILMALKVALSGQVDVESAFSFKQDNDEVDVWDAGSGRRYEKWRVETTSL
jgi:probable phosphoglycerate mutase